jgi:hypothetical protein
LAARWRLDKRLKGRQFEAAGGGVFTDLFAASRRRDS